MTRGIWAVGLTLVLSGWMNSASAGRDFTPQAGLWSIPSEGNGEPGRGFSLDVQGNTAFLQVFNYDKSGAATFHTAVGQLDASGAMTVPLLRFKGGRWFGGPVQDAVEDGSAGNITVRFTDGLNGSVQFPGESKQPIARFLLNPQTPPWWTQASAEPPAGKEGEQRMHWIVQTKDGARDILDAWLRMDDDSARYVLTLNSELTKNLKIQTLNCQFEVANQVFDCTHQSGSEMQLGIQRLRFRIVGADVVGQIQPSWDGTQRLMLNGWDEGSFSCDANASWCNGSDKRSARVYMNSDFLSGICITGYCSGYDHLTQIPSSGAWIIDDEKTGKPGRGVFIDAQSGTVIVQTSDYLESGNPTFHMGVATLSSSVTYGEASTASKSLQQYEGGRYFGSPPQSGRLASEAGTLSMSFVLDHSNYNDFDEIVKGTVALPGEAAKTMSRMQFQPPADGIDHMLGEYFVRWSTATSSVKPGFITLGRVVDGRFAMNDDGTIQCYQNIPRTDAYSMRCALLPTPNLQQTWLGSVTIHASPFGRSNPPGFPEFVRRTRDAQGNWLGLGMVNLPGLAIPASD